MILDLILIGLAITLEPIPLTAFILVLASEGGVRKGAAFVFGWLLSLAAVVAVTLVATDNNPPRPSTAPALAALATKIAIGLILLFIGLRQWRRMGEPKKPKKPPKWQTGIDKMSLAFAMLLGILVQPWGLVAAGVAVIVEAKLTTVGSYVALLSFCVLSVITYAALEIYAGLRPARTQAFLAATKTWIETHQDQAIIVVSLLLGFWLIGKSCYLLID